MTDSSPPTPILRLQLLIYERGETLIRGFLLVGVLAATFAGFMAVNPDRTLTSEKTNVQTVSATADHSALVTNGTETWENGTQLRNRSTYFTNVSPQLLLDGRITVPANRSVNVTQQLVLLVNASRDGQAFYENRTVLDGGQRTVTNGTATATASVNVTQIRQRLDGLRDSFGPVAQLSVSVRYLVRYDTGDYRGTVVAASPLLVDGDAYWLSDRMTASQTHSQTRTTVSESTNWMAVFALAILSIFSIGTAATIRVYEQADLDKDDLLLALHSQQMSEWISDGELPMWLGEEHVRLESLQDVVDIGIDNEKRVVHDPRRDLYAIVDGSVVYYYCEENSWHDLPRPRLEGNGTLDVEPSDKEPDGDFGFDDPERFKPSDEE